MSAANPPTPQSEPSDEDGHTLAGQFINHEAAIDLDLTYWHLAQVPAEEPQPARVLRRPS